MSQKNKLLSISVPHSDQFSKLFYWYTQQKIAIKRSLKIPPTLRYTTLWNINFWQLICWEQCLAKMRTHPRPHVWQTATVVTEASHCNSCHRIWVSDQRISNRCSAISTLHLSPSATEWMSFVVRRTLFAPVFILCCSRCIDLQSICEFFGVANVSSFFVTELNQIHTTSFSIQQQELFWAAEFRKAVCFSQFFSRCLFKHFEPRLNWKNNPYDSRLCLVC